MSLTPSELGESLCLGADVTQGDSIIADRNVGVSFEPGTGQGGARMRVRTTVAIEEPVVAVNVRAGCDARSTRSYTLLADVPSDISSPVVTPAPVRPVAPRPVPVPGTAAGNIGAGSGARGGQSDGAASAGGSASRSSPERRRDPASAEAAPPARRPAASTETPRRAASPPPSAPRNVPQASAPSARAGGRVPAASPDAAAGGSRLRLDALDPAAAVNGGLKTTSQLSLPAVENPARRAEAAALWRALSGETTSAAPAVPSAEEAQRQQVAQANEVALATLRRQMADNQRALSELRAELASAQESRYQNPFVYLLGLLLLLALIGMALLWRQARRSAASPAWWGEPSAAERPGATGRTFVPPDDDDGEDAGGKLLASSAGAAQDRHPDYEPPIAHPSRLADAGAGRSVNTEELFDVQQQSDFFLSLGQHEQAIAVLQEHIAANPGTSALAYLDLLRIYHSLERRDDYARLAAEFEHAFNADVPPFERFNEASGRGLEHYGAAMSRIQAKWPEPGTLALIEELVFRKPGGHGDDAFDLAAYQELLLLYSVAKEVIDPNTPTLAARNVDQPFEDTYVHAELKTRPGDLDPETKPDLAWDAPELPGDQADTAAAPLETSVPPSPPRAAPRAAEPRMPTQPDVEPQDAPLPSIYTGIDDDQLRSSTEFNPLKDPEAPVTVPADVRAPDAPHDESAPSARFVSAPAPLDLADFDRTSYETMPSPLEAEKPVPAIDPHSIDFELFDPATEAEIAPKPKPGKR